MKKVKAKKFKVIELPNMVGKSIKEVKEYLEKTYPGQLAGEEHQDAFEKSKPELPSWTACFFFGSLRYCDGNWCVPNSRWDGSSFRRNAYWLGNGWSSNCRVVLIDKDMTKLKKSINL